MKKFSCKVLPIFRNKNKKKCCICLEIKRNCVSCTNPKCSEGIVCLKCLGQMKDSQKQQCQICRVEMEAFKTGQVQVKPVENITNCRNKIKCCKRGETRPSCCKTMREGICLLFMTILFLAVTYSSGLICLFWFTGIMHVGLNPIIVIVIGIILIVIMFTLIWSCGVLKIYLIDKYCLNKY